MQEAKRLSEMSASLGEEVGGNFQIAVNPIHPAYQKLLPLLLAPRCGARTRAGSPCLSPKVNGKTRCRMHGGARGSGAPRGEANGRYNHRNFTCESIQDRAETRALLRLVRETMATL